MQKIHLGPLLTSFLRDYEVDEGILTKMKEAAIDHAVLSKGHVPEEFRAIIIEKWGEDYVVIRDRSFSEMDTLSEEEDLLSILSELNKRELTNFTENFCESVIGVVRHGDQET